MNTHIGEQKQSFRNVEFPINLSFLKLAWEYTNASNKEVISHDLHVVELQSKFP